MIKGSKFSYFTVRKLIEEIKKEGRPTFCRSSFYRLAKKFNWPIPSSAGTGGWNRFNQETIDKLKKLINEHFSKKKV